MHKFKEGQSVTIRNHFGATMDARIDEINKKYGGSIVIYSTLKEIPDYIFNMKGHGRGKRAGWVLLPRTED